MGFLKKLIHQVLLNGKLLLGYIVVQVPELTNYPGLLDSLNEFFSNPNFSNGFALLFQIFLAGSAGHRLLKVIKTAL